MVQTPARPDLNAFTETLRELNLGGHWEVLRGESLVQTPTPKCEPCLWKWDSVYAKLREAGEVYDLGDSNSRRTLRLINPALRGNVNCTLHTLHMSTQLVNPGEVAYAHRHTMAAIRFVVQGSHTFTTVEGEPLRMEPGDLILTPNWTWHDHANEGDEPIVWLDGLDSPIIQYFGARFQEPFSDRQQPRTKPEGYSLGRYGLGRVSQADEFADPPFRYPWRQMRAQLEALAETPGNPYDGILLEYANPRSGGHTMRTMSCFIQMLRPGETTEVHRHTSADIFHVVEGSGVTTVGDDGQQLRWGQHDTFVVPNWTWHKLENTSRSEPAILFRMSDLAQVDAFGLYREESESGPVVAGH